MPNKFVGWVRFISLTAGINLIQHSRYTAMVSPLNIRKANIMQNTLQNSSLSLQQLYQLVAHYSVEQQFEIAEYIKKQALAVKWGQFAKAMPIDEPDISGQGIIEEIKAVRAERSGK